MWAPELSLLLSVASALGVVEDHVHAGVRQSRYTEDMARAEPGMGACFAGAAITADGGELARATLVGVAAQMGLCVVDAVAKKRSDLLIATNASSQSGKAAKARHYGIPVVEVRHFLCAECGGEIPAC